MRCVDRVRLVRSLLIPRPACVVWAPLLAIVQAPTADDLRGYRYRYILETLGWAEQFARERWYLLVLAGVLAVMVWRYLRS